MRILLIVALLALTGCATPLTEYEREDRLIVTSEAWLYCKYIHQGIWVTKDSSYASTRIKRDPSYHDMKKEMATNTCHVVLGD